MKGKPMFGKDPKAIKVAAAGAEGKGKTKPKGKDMTFSKSVKSKKG